MDGVIVRIETQADKEAVRELTARAFGRPDEAQIIPRLEADGDVLLQLVAELDERIVGHLLMYGLPVRGRLSAVGLGPISVDPWVQREGIGKRLITAALGMARQGGVPIVFVLGHPEYYPKFGFTVEATAEFETPLKGPSFMALRMRHGPPMSGQLMFPRAFGVSNA